MLVGVVGAVVVGCDDPSARRAPDSVAGRATRPAAWKISAVADGAATELQDLEAARRRIDETTWAPELRAQVHEEVFIQLWDALRASTNGWRTLDGFNFGELRFRKAGPVRITSLGIEERQHDGEELRWERAAVARATSAWEREGWQLVQSEFRHRRYREETDRPRTSVFHASLHWRRASPAERLSLTTELEVTWRPTAEREEPPFPGLLRATDLVIRRRPETGMFVRQFSRPIVPVAGMPFIDPLIVQDVDRNGYPELILGCKNEVYWNRDGRRFELGRLAPGNRGLGLTSLVCDVNGDGALDLVWSDQEGLSRIEGRPGGGFGPESRRSWIAPARLENPFVLAAGDIDGDGDLDFWLGQYKVPYVAGQMPTPYYDANDGFPGYLLIQDQAGTFHDGTDAAGLAAKRHRRAYSAVFADWEGDGDLDLSIVSDFAGVDVFRNDGTGRFLEMEPVRPEVVEAEPSVGLAPSSRASSGIRGNPRGFGMAQSLADFDGDGVLDLLMIGMNSYTGQRLAGMGLGVELGPDYAQEREAMSRGNRLFRGTPSGWEESEISRELAETGWAWGVAVADFDNDGELDVHVVNGHKSRGTVRDYERQFWRHDIYVGTSETNSTSDLYFQAVAGRLYGEGWSYGGFDKNRLLVGRGNGEFMEAGWLVDVAFEDDFRNSVAADLDMDGRVDLVGTTYGSWPEGRQGLHVFRNEITNANRWVGFRLQDGGRGKTALGACVTLRAGGRVQKRWIVAGDSYRAQHPAIAHFGLGVESRVDRVDVRWPDGTVQTVERPEPDRYHDVAQASSGRTSSP